MYQLAFSEYHDERSIGDRMNLEGCRRLQKNEEIVEKWEILNAY